MATTVYTGALIRTGRALFGTFRTDGAFVALATGAIIPVLADDVFTSRGNVTNHAISRKGSALLTGSTMSLSGIPIDPRRIYDGPAAFIRYAAVGKGVPEDRKADLIGKVADFYGIELS